jgi:hypothetical protein
VLKANNRADISFLDDYGEEITRGGHGVRGVSKGRMSKDRIALAATGVAVCAILVNALFLQNGPHPAPIFSARPASPMQQASRAQLPEQAEPQIPPQAQAQQQAQIQTPVPTPPPAPASAVAQTSAKIAPASAAKPVRVVGGELTGGIASAPPRPPENVGFKSESGKGANTTARHDPIGALLAPSSAPASSPSSAASANISPQRIVLVQRALSDFGYGQIKPSGILDAPTKEAIGRFERARKLPISGEVSPRLLRELSAVTGRPLE